MTDILDTIDELDDEFEDDEDFEGDALEGELVEYDAEADLENFEMNERQAKEITEAIKSASTALYILIAQAHRQKAWKALGYNDWSSYVKGEFDISASHSYRLLDQAKVVELIEEALPEDTPVKLTEAQARDIKRELPRITEQLKEETQEMSPEEAAQRAQEFIEEQRQEMKEQEKAEKKAAEAKEKALAEAEEDGYQAGLEAAADALLESDRPDGMTDSADDGLLEVEVEGDGDVSAEDSMNIYNFFNMLQSITNLPEPDEFIKIVPPGRVDEINEQLLTAAAWLNRFQTIWEMREDDARE